VVQAADYIGRRLKEDFANGRSYYGLAGTKLELPREAALRPAAEAMAWHREHVFIG
jgi:hypothetical protein